MGLSMPHKTRIFPNSLQRIHAFSFGAFGGQWEWSCSGIRLSVF